MLVDINTTFRVVHLNIILEGLKAQLVAIFEVAIVFSVLLHCIICQVHKCVVYIFKINAELCGRSSQISLLEEEQFMILIE